MDTYRLCRCGPVSSLSDSIHSKYWQVGIASSPGDMLWSVGVVYGWVWSIMFACVGTICHCQDTCGGSSGH